MNISPEQYTIAEKNGISARNVYQRYYAYGWTIERAITEPLTYVTKERIGWTEWKEVAEQNGINRDLFKWRRRVKKMTPEQAATAPRMRASKC